jgi:hypothetical protein
MDEVAIIENQTPEIYSNSLGGGGGT